MGWGDNIKIDVPGLAGAAGAPEGPPVPAPFPISVGGIAPADIGQGLLGSAGAIGVPGTRRTALRGMRIVGRMRPMPRRSFRRMRLIRRSRCKVWVRKRRR